MQIDKDEIKQVENLELEELAATKDNSLLALGADKYLSLVKDVEIRLTAVLGAAQVTVGELFELKQGGVLALDKLSDEPIELVLNGQIVARGSLVVVEDSFGIQLTEVCEL